MNKFNLRAVTFVLAILLILASTACQAEKQTLVVNSFGGRWEQAERAIVVDPFAKANNAEITVAVTGVSADILARLRAEKGNPSWDVVVIGGGLERQAAAEGLLEPLNEANIPNLKDLHPSAKQTMAYGPSLAFSGVGIAYNTEKIKTPPSSWLDFWKPEYAGHIGIQNMTSNFGAAHFVVVNEVSGGSKTNVEPGFQKFKELMQTGKPVMLQTVDDANTAMTSRDIWIVVTTSSGAVTLAQGKFPVNFVYPQKEGGLLWGNYLGIPKGSKHKELGEKFINYFLDPNVQGSWNAQVGYSPTNLKAQIPADFAYADWLKVDKLFPLDLDYVNANRAAWLERWNKEVLPLLGK